MSKEEKGRGKQKYEIIDIVEKGFNELTTERLADKWKSFFLRYNEATVNEKGKSVLRKPYIEQLKQMGSLPPLIFGEQGKGSGNTIEELGRKIFQIDYNDLVEARTDILGIYEPDEEEEEEEKQRNVGENEPSLREIDIKILCYGVKNDWGRTKEAIKSAILTLLKRVNKDYVDRLEREKSVNDIIITLTNFEITKPLMEIGSHDLDKMVRIRGVVSEFDDSASIEVSQTTWECKNCTNTTSISGRKPPSKCASCNEKLFEENPVYTRSQDFMYFVLQDPHETLKQGQLIPPSKNVSITGTDFVNSVYSIMAIGKTVAINGIPRLAELVKGNSLIASVEIECIGIEVVNENVAYDDRIRSEVSKDIPIDEIEEHYEKLKRSMAPWLEGLEPQKEGILLQTVGAPPLQVRGQSSKMRGDINILLLGDAACVVAGTKIVLGNGQIVNIESLGKKHLQSINVQVLTGEGNRKREYATVFHKYEKKPIIEIITDTGKSVKGTYNHPMRIFDGQKKEFLWKRLDEIKLGDRVVAMNTIPCTLSSPIKTDFKVEYSSPYGPKYNGKIPEIVEQKLAAIMGYNIGDGWIRSSRDVLGFIISEQERELLDPLVYMMVDLFGIEPSIYEKVGTTHQTRDGQLFKATMNMIYLEYGSKGLIQMLSFLRVKRVPDMIFRSPNAVVEAFLRWLFQADGTVFDNGRGRRAIVLTSVNLDLLRDVQLLLLRFGIWSRIAKRKDRAANLIIGRGYSIIKYAKHIGFVSKNKRYKLDELAKHADVFKHRTQQRTEKVVNISYQLEPEDVYDIEVPNKHRFIANGLISHNTGKSELLHFAHSLNKNAIYVQGQNASKVGLTAAIKTTEVLRAGQLIKKTSLTAGVYGMASKPGGLICLTGDNEIFTGHSLEKIKNIWESGIEIPRPNEYDQSVDVRKVPHLVLPTFHNYINKDGLDAAKYVTRRWYEGEVVKITLGNGLTVETTPDHLIRMTSRARKRQWKAMDNVSVGEKVKSPVSLPSHSLQVSMEEREAYLMGVIYGDGYISELSVTISGSRRYLDIINHLERISPYRFRRYDKARKMRELHMPNGKMYVIAEQSIHLYSSNKILLSRAVELLKPIDKILTLSDRSLAAFFGGCIDADGSIHINKNRNQIYAIDLYLTQNEHELNVLIHALKRFSIRGKIRRYPSLSIPRISITGHHIKRFIDLVTEHSLKLGKTLETMGRPRDFGFAADKYRDRFVIIKDNEEIITKIERRQFSGYVYDFTMSSSHNFECSITFLHNCLDELTKVANDEHYEVMSSAMDDFATMYIHKNVAHTEIKVNCASLHAANPVTNKGRYDVTLDGPSQTNFHTWLWSRYDLKFLHIARRDDVSRHLLWQRKAESFSQMESTKEGFDEKGLKLNRRRKSTDFFSRDYLIHEIAFLRERYLPYVEFETGKLPWLTLMEFWNYYNSKSVTPTRQDLDRGDLMSEPLLDERAMNSLIRLAMASAVLHRRLKVTVEDVANATNLMKISIAQFIPKIDEKDSELRSVASAQIMLSEGLKKGVEMAMREKNETMQNFVRGMVKCVNFLHRKLFRGCEDCKGRGVIQPDLGLTEGDKRDLKEQKYADRNHIPCHSCLGMRGSYQPFDYHTFQDYMYEAKISIYSKEYFELLRKANMIVRDSEPNVMYVDVAPKMSGVWKVVRDLQGNGIVQMTKLANEMLGYSMPSSSSSSAAASAFASRR